MANSVPGQIISELGGIGKKVGGEVAKVPKDIAGKALESLCVNATNTQGQKKQTTSSAGGASPPVGAWEKIDIEKDERIRKAMAHEALKQLAGGKVKRKELSVWERLQQEQEEKRQQGIAQKAAAAATQLVIPPSKRPRGDL